MNDEIKKLPGKPPRGLPFGEKSSGKSSEYMMKMPGKPPRGLPFDEPVKKMGGGSVKGYRIGGSVARGGGAATRGTKFKGVC